MKPDMAHETAQYKVVTAYGETSVGKVRVHNEDSFYCDSSLGLWLIADGVGGHKGGKIASQMLCDELPLLLANGKTITQSIETVHQMILRAPKQGKGYEGMATTLVAVRKSGNHFEIHWLGDSRAYLVSPQHISQLTKDHTLYQQMCDVGLQNGQLAARHSSQHILTRSLGGRNQHPVKLDSTSLVLQPNDKLLLCSDGLSNELSEMELFDVVSQKQSKKDIVKQLVDTANRKGGRDNITALLIGFASSLSIGR